MDEPVALRVPPHSIEAEQAVLGALLLDSGAWDSVGDLLAERDFYRKDHALIFRAIGRLAAACRAADVITVWEALRAEGLGDKITLRYLNDMTLSVSSARMARSYAEIVRQRAVSRDVIAAADELITGVYGAGRAGASLADLVDRAVLGLMALQQGGSKQEPLLAAELLSSWLDALQDRADGKTDAIPTHLRDIDRALGGGLRPGELIVLGARPSMGKSALAGTIGANVAADGPVAVLTMEDSSSMLVSRQVSRLARVNLADVRNPAHAPSDFWGRVADGVEALGRLQLYIDDQACLSLMDVRRKAIQVKQRAGGQLRLIIVDYLQLMEDEGETRSAELAGIARGLKRLAKEIGAPVILLSQLNREADKLPGPPRLDHLRESGAIEEAADVVGLLWREARRNPKPDNKHRAQVEFAKNKSGACDTVHLFFDGATQRFDDLAEGMT